MKHILPLAALLLLAAPVHADDFGLWGDVSVQKNLGKHFSIDGSFGFRQTYNPEMFTRYDFSVGADYKPCRYFSVGYAYTFIRDYHPEEVKDKYDDDDDEPDFKGYNVSEQYLRSKRRSTLDLTARLPLGRFTLTLRERYQYTYFVQKTYTKYKYRKENATYYDGVYTYNNRYFRTCKTEDKVKPGKYTHYLRSRIALDYNIRHCPLTPFASYEFSNNLRESMHLDKQRLTAGVEWKVSKHHRLTFAYVYNNGADDDTDADYHVASIGYKIKF